MSGVVQASPDPRRWLALAVVLLAVLMDLIDNTVVLIAAPTIRADLGGGYAGIQWIVAAYSLTLGLLLVTGGRLGDIVGRKRMFLAGVVGFTLASVACGAAPSIGALIAARVVQGAAAAMMVPQVLATIQVGFPLEERARAFGMYGALNGLAAATAPIVGGLLVGNDVLGLRWRSVFLINLPIGVLAFAGAAALMPESRSADRPPLDVPGVLIGSAALLLLLFPLIQGAELGWPAWAFVAMAASVPALAGFGWHQSRRERTGGALVPVSLFRQRSFAAGLVGTIVMFSSIGAFFLVLTIQLQVGHHLRPLAVGFTFLAFPIGLVVSSGLALRLAASVGRRLVTFGAALLTAAMAVLIATLAVSGHDLVAWHLVPGLLLGGLGFGLVAPVLVDIVLSAVPPTEAGAASGVINTAIQVAGAAGVAVIGALFATVLHATGDIDLAARQALWYPVLAFAAGFLLSFGLPRR